MKKIYIALAIASLSLAMSSCGNDDTPDSPEDEFAGMQKDVFVLNQGMRETILREASISLIMRISLMRETFSRPSIKEVLAERRNVASHMGASSI